MNSIDVLAICGSVRAESFNQALLRAAQELAGDRLQVDVWDDFDSLPRLDVTRGRPFPQVALALRGRVAAADLLLLVTPEYNRSIPGTLKDVVDWLSIPMPPEPLVGKPVALMSASPNQFGGAFAQLQLADLLRRLGADVITDLDVAVGDVHNHIDEHSALVGAEPRRAISEVWQRVLRRPGLAAALSA